MNKISSFVGWLGNHKYAAAIILFAVLLGFVDDNSLYQRYKNQQECKQLKAEIRIYKDRYESDTRKLEELAHNSEAVRHVARTRYYMKRANEDVFVFADTTSTATLFSSR